ncbi:hypothetical protein [Halococcus thailandensis]|uniref:hypothetical protein n=1 Tax=Halococcus thailandensis TaxID=335952 RepID=UPI0012683D32|nr:hypothetical protein [Halococcus thailandensis]
MTDDNSTSDANSGEGESFNRKYPDRLLEHGRERGLSRADREYLASGGETIAESENAHVNIRHRIRSRVRESIVDFWLLTEYLEDRDRELIFRKSNNQWDDWELQIGLKSAIQFFYTALDESSLVDFETVLVSGISDAEHKRSDRPVQVDVDFDVEVDDQFHVKEAYEKFQRGVPLSPREIGTLLLTGTVRDPAEIQRLSYHARSNSFIENALTPLLSKQLSSISDEEERIENFRYHWSHLPHEYSPMENGVDMPRHSDFFYLEDELEFQQQEHEQVTPEASTNEKVDEGHAADREAVLRELSVDLDEPITVGDEVVYEDGDRHPLDPDGGERGADSPADTDDAAGSDG